MAKNYWVTSTGTVYEGISGHGSWHTEFCNSFLECHEEILKHYDEWYEKHHNYIHIFFEWAEMDLNHRRSFEQLIYSQPP